MENPYNKKIKFYDKTLPKILKSLNGKNIKNKKDWLKRRKEILYLFEKNIFGNYPKRGFDVKYKIDYQKNIFNNKAIRKQVRLIIKTKMGSKTINLMLYLPKTNKPVPVVSILNFHGNFTIDKDTDLPLQKTHVDFKNYAIIKKRGYASKTIPIKEILRKGFGILTASKEDFDMDVDGKENRGIQKLFSSKYTWGTISAWAWGLSRMADFLEKEKMVDKSKLIVMGLSRLGKAALWAGAQDKRFKLTISINSGGSGAKLSRCYGGETIKAINTGKPFWFCKKYKKYNNKEGKLPIDQHMLMSLIAPRYLYVASSEKDEWANPKGEFISCMLTEPAFEIYKLKGLGTNIFPKLNSQISIGNVGYHIKKGKHGLNIFDWEKCINFTEKI